MKFSIWHILIGIVVLTLGTFLFFWISKEESVEQVEDRFYETIPVVSNASEQGRASLLERAFPYTDSFESLQESFYSDKYSIFLCKEEDGAEQVLVWPAEYQIVDSEYTLAPVKRAVDEWSQYMIGDVGNIVYPDIDLGDTFPTATFLKFGDVYVAEFSIDNREYEIVYTWMNNLLVITSSRECIEDLEHTYHSH